MDFGKIPLMKQLKLINGQPAYPVAHLPADTLKLWTYKQQFFVLCSDGNLYVYQ
jgi:hypothetical protein